MERHRCKLCFRSFSNGRALGGHMRSHMVNLPIPSKPEETPKQGPPPPPVVDHLSDEAESASSPSPSSSSEKGVGLGYGLRENPKRSIRLGDSEFSFAVDAGSVVLQDRESETESSKNPTGRRSKRTRIPFVLEHQFREEDVKMELEPASSISDTTTEEDVAFCLMMLSRDKWTEQQELENGDEEDEEEQREEPEVEKSFENSDDSEELKFSKNRTLGKYRCETCDKVFRSYQALGGHRASHKKTMKLSGPELERENAGASASMANKRIHECPVCFRVFSSGQALGGHKRSHVTGLTQSTKINASAAKFGDNLIDLNLPAPIDEDDASQIELSAVSDAEFVNPSSIEVRR